MTSNPLFKIQIIFSTLFLLLIGGTALFQYLEPGFTLIQSFYFTVTIMTTVGSGDLLPTNDITRLAVSLYILVAVTLYVSLIAQSGTHYLEYQHSRALRREEQKRRKK